MMDNSVTLMLLELFIVKTIKMLRKEVICWVASLKSEEKK
jgi:hypothetical protein